MNHSAALHIIELHPIAQEDIEKRTEKSEHIYFHLDGLVDPLRCEEQTGAKVKSSSSLMFTEN